MYVAYMRLARHLLILLSFAFTLDFRATHYLVWCCFLMAVDFQWPQGSALCAVGSLLQAAGVEAGWIHMSYCPGLSNVLLRWFLFLWNCRFRRELFRWPEVTVVKIDPYLNEDAGTLSPEDHGEVFVLEDGTEVDLDFGHYERALGASEMEQAAWSRVISSRWLHM